mgnify:CR=1 FL=1
MTHNPFVKKTIYPSLQGIETVTEAPYTVSDLASVRRFYTEFKDSTFDTASFILWKKDRKFKVTNNFPWEDVAIKYLGDSLLGQKSILEILPSHYEGLEEEEFELIRPADDPSELYAVKSKYTFLGKNYTLEELQERDAGLLGSGLTKREAYVHPIWLALFRGNVQELEMMVDWVWDFRGDNERFMGVYLENPGKLCALTWKSRGLINDANIIATTGFNNEKKFLTNS